MCFGIASRVEFMNFKKTSIIERLALLTLIILGEGVIGICASISRVGVDHSFSSDVIGMIICAIVIIYLIWMLYHDQVCGVLLRYRAPLIRCFRLKRSMSVVLTSIFG